MVPSEKRKRVTKKLAKIANANFGLLDSYVLPSTSKIANNQRDKKSKSDVIG